MSENNERSEVWTIEFESNIGKWLQGLHDAGGAWQKLGQVLTKVDDRADDVYTAGRAGLTRLQQGWASVRQGISEATAVLLGHTKSYADFGKIANTATRELVIAIQQTAQVSGQSFEQIAQDMQKMGVISVTEQGRALKAYTAVIGDAEVATTSFANQVGRLGAAAKTAFILLLGNTALQQIRKVIAAINEAIEVAVQWEFTLFRLNVAIRAFQRQAGDVAGTIDEWAGFIEQLRDKFRVFTRDELRETAATLVILTRNLAFTSVEMQNLIERTALLALIKGKDLRTAVRSVSVGLTGYRRGLYDLGINYSNVQLQNEAFRLGLIETAGEMDNVVKAHASLSLIMKQSEPLMEDASAAVETYYGTFQELAARQEEATRTIGATWAPLLELIKTLWTGITEAVATAHLATQLALIYWTGQLAKVAGVLLATIGLVKGLRDGTIEVGEAAAWWGEQMASLEVFASDAQRAMAEALGAIPPLAEDVTQSIFDLGNAWAELQALARGASLDLAGDIDDALEDYQRDLLEKREDLLEKLAELEEDLLQGLAERREDYLRKLTEIEEDYATRRAELAEDLATKLARVDEELQEKRADATNAFHLKELRAEEDFQRALARLYQSYVLDLYGALEKRDARAILNIRRQYKIRRREMTEDFEVARQRRLEDYENRDEEYEGWAEERRAQIQDDYEDRLEDLETQLERRLAKELESYKRAREAFRKSADRRRLDALLAYKRSLQDLRDNLYRTLRTLGEGLADQEDMTRKGAHEVYKRLFEVFGPSGYIDALMASFETRFARRLIIETQVDKVGGGIEEKTEGINFGNLFNPPTPNDPGIIVPTQQRTTTPVATSVGEVRVTVVADEHFSPDFENRLYEDLTNSILTVVQRMKGV